MSFPSLKSGPPTYKWKGSPALNFGLGTKMYKVGRRGGGESSFVRERGGEDLSPEKPPFFQRCLKRV